MTDRDKIIYLAGLVDGEGSINITQYKIQNNKKIRWRPSIRLQMTDKEGVELFANTFGFNIYHYKGKEGHRDIYGCDAAWHGCERILTALIPYLIIKRRLAAIVIEFCQHVSDYKFFRMKRPGMLRNKKGQIISSLGSQMSYEEAKWRYDQYCLVKTLVHPKSISSHRKRLSEEALQELKELEEMRQSELKRKESSEIGRNDQSAL